MLGNVEESVIDFIYILTILYIILYLAAHLFSWMFFSLFQLSMEKYHH
jgi:hypothetical protein